MLNIGGLHQGVVIDHIQAGAAMKIYEYLNLDEIDVCLAAHALSERLPKSSPAASGAPRNIFRKMLQPSTVKIFSHEGIGIINAAPRPAQQPFATIEPETHALYYARWRH